MRDLNKEGAISPLIFLSMICEFVIFISPMLDLDYNLKRNEVPIYISNLVAVAILIIKGSYFLKKRGRPGLNKDSIMFDQRSCKYQNFVLYSACYFLTAIRSSQRKELFSFLG